MLSTLREKSKAIIWGVVILFGVTLFYGFGSSLLGGRGERSTSSEDQSVLALVNGKPVYLDRYQQVLQQLYRGVSQPMLPRQAAEFQAVALNQALDYTLMLQAAERKVRVEHREVEATIQKLAKDQKVDLERFKQQLKRSGQSWEQFEALVAREVLLTKWRQKLMEEVKVTDADLKELHAMVFSYPIGKDKAASRRKAEQELPRIRSGSLKTGGIDLGWITSDRLSTSMAAPLFQLKRGETSQILEQGGHFTIFRVLDVRVRKPSKAGIAIQEEVKQKKQQTFFFNTLRELREQAHLEIKEPIHRAFYYLARGDRKEAKRSLEQAITQNGNNPYPYLFLGQIALDESHKKEARRYFDQASRIPSGDAYFCYALGLAYESVLAERGKLSGGEQILIREQFSRASKFAGDDLSLRRALLQHFQSQGDSELTSREAKEIARLARRQALEKKLLSSPRS